MQEGYWVIRTYEAGVIGEKTKYFVPGTRPTGKIRRKDRELARKQEQNEYSSQKELARLLNANFRDGDLLLGLDYSDKGMSKIRRWAEKNGYPVDADDPAVAMDALWYAADHELSNCLRRAKRKAEQLGLEAKAVYSTSDTDGETGEAVRVHHHLVINREALPCFMAAWEDAGMGHVDYSPLWSNQEDRTPVAEYMIRQVRHIPNAKKYHSTKNLERPKPKDRIALSDAEMRVPKNSRLLFRSEFKPGRPQYIRYAMDKKMHDRR